MAVITQRTNMAPGLGTAFGEGLTQGYEQEADRRALQNAIGRLPPNAKPQEVLNALLGTKASLEAKQNVFKNYLGAAEFEAKQNEVAQKKQAELEKKQAEVLKEQQKQIKDRDTVRNIVNSTPGLSDEEKQQLGEQLDVATATAMFKEKIKFNKQAQKEAEEKVEQETTQRAFDELVGLIPKVGRMGVPGSYLGGDTAKSFAQFTSLTGALESFLVDKVSRGALSKSRFDYITKTLLPQPSDTQAEIEGKLQGLATMLNLDASALTGEQKPQGQSTQGSRPSLSSFERK